MKRTAPQILLMLFTIIGVAGFQIFWLKQTYDREKKALALKTDFVFREAILNERATGLNLPQATDSVYLRDIAEVKKDSGLARMTFKLDSRKGMVSTINVISRKISDSSKMPGINKEIFVTHDRFFSDSGIKHSDSAVPKNHFVRLLYDIDSLQKPLNIKSIDTAVAAGLKKAEADIPFSIEKEAGRADSTDEKINEVSMGFTHPVIYRFVPGNTFFYLLKRITLPISFSVLLTVLTVISFVLLYRNLRKQQKLTDSKNEFIANMTHELKTPIATVSVAIEALRDFNAIKEPARAEEYLGIAGQELSRLSMMVDKVLRLSVFENRSTELKYENFDLAVLTREVMQTMQLQFEKAGAQISLQLTGNDFNIDADRMHIASVLYNLLDNAIKYSAAKPAIHTAVISEPGSFTIRIADEGIGIDPAYRHKIFEKFFRVPHGDLHNVKGYGLGLSYAAHITEQHNGSIRAEANGNAGTVFIIKLPRAHGN